MRKHTWRLGGLVLLFAAILTVSAFAAGEGVVTATGLYLRSEANTGALIRIMAPNSATVTLTGAEENGWYPVSYKGYTGYMSAEYIRVTYEPEAPQPQPQPEAGVTPVEAGTVGTVTATDVNVRSAPVITAGNILGRVSTGYSLTVTGKTGNWYQVEYNGGCGYISADYLRLKTPGSETEPVPLPPADTAAAIVETAKSFQGTPYVYGGMSPAGFDCSGFVGYVYKQHGFNLSRTAANMCTNNGTEVARADMQPGDLIFFLDSSYTYVGHVGMYIGNNQFIHASSSNRCVLIASTTGSWFDSHFVCAKRILG